MVVTGATPSPTAESDLMNRTSLGFLALALITVAGVAAFYFLPTEGTTPLTSPSYGEAAGASEEEVSQDLRGAPGDESSQDERARETGVRETGVDPTVVLGSVSGRVTDAKGRPVVGARVALRETGRDPRSLITEAVAGASNESDAAEIGKPKRSTETDGEGRFRIVPRTTTEALQLTVHAARMIRYEKSVEPTEGRAVDLGEIRLDPGIVFTGRVVDAYGKAVRSARVAAMPKAAANVMVAFNPFGAMARRGGVETDREGRFEVVVQKPGEFELVAHHDEHAAGKTTVIAKTAGETVQGILVQLAPSAEITGVVKGVPADSGAVEIHAITEKPEAASAGMVMSMIGNPLAFAEKRAQVKADGSFRITGLARAAEYKIAAFAKGNGPMGVQVSKVRSVTSGARAVELTFERGVVVVFQAIAQSGEPFDLVKATAKLDSASGSGFDITAMLAGRRNTEVEAGPDGKFRLAALRPTRNQQTMSVTIEAEGYKAWKKSGIAMPVSGEVDLGLVRLDKAPMLRVIVTNADGEAIENARVRFERIANATAGRARIERRVRVGGWSGNDGSRISFGQSSPSAKTDEDGVAELTLADRLEGRIRVTHRDYAQSISDAVVASAAGVTERAITLSSGGTIEVAVVDSKGSPVVGARIKCTSLDAGASATRKAPIQTNAEGIAIFRAVAPGDYDVAFDERSGMFAGGMIRTEVRGASQNTEEREIEGKRVRVLESRTARVSLEQPLRTRVVGTVTLDGLPLVGARVRVAKAGSGIESMMERMAGGSGLGALLGGRGGSTKGKTKSDGSYEVEDVKVGPVKLSVSHEKLVLPSVVELRAIEGETRHDIALRTTRVRGLVVDSKGDPVAGARVTVQKAKMTDTERAMSGARVMLANIDGNLGGAAATATTPDDGGVRTASDGSFELVGVPSGVEIVVRASAAAFAEASSAAMTLRSGETKSSVRVEMKRGGAIEVLVPADKVGFGIVSVRRGEGVDGLKTGRIKDGRALISGLGSGIWKVSLPSLSGADEREVEVKPGETAKVDFAR